jgi:hypothetical protein
LLSLTTITLSTPQPGQPVNKAARNIERAVIVSIFGRHIFICYFFNVPVTLRRARRLTGRTLAQWNAALARAIIESRQCAHFVARPASRQFHALRLARTAAIVYHSLPEEE